MSRLATVPSSCVTGNPSQSTSLHYMSPYQLNAYALALTAVGEIIQHYDSDKMFPALGFGAKLPPDGRVSHEFPLNGNQENPSCCGIDGILEAYHHSLRTVQLYGPTNFAPVVTHVARNAATVQDGSQYSVLLIITDGVISDMAQTKEAIVNVSRGWGGEMGSPKVCFPPSFRETLRAWLLFSLPSLGPLLASCCRV